MKSQTRWWCRPCVVLLAMLVMGVAGRAADRAAGAESIDWSRAQQLREKAKSGGALTNEERAYLERAIGARRKSQPPAGRAAAGGAAPQARERTGLVPLTELPAEERYKGEDGGLYGGGRNEPPAAHLKAALAATREIKPRSVDGTPSPQGKIALLAVGMSNTTQEFSRFQEVAGREGAKAAEVVLVDGAQGGRTAAEWARRGDNAVWQTVESRLRAAGVTAPQVQVVWIKQANARPSEPFPEHARKLEADLVSVVKRLKATFPNLQLAYLSSRTYGGYAVTPLNPEPYAYESAFAVRWLILRQLKGQAELNHDAARGTVNAPVLLWGPYLWADGVEPRKADRLTWERADFRDDGTHPSATTGRDKVANQLLTFLKSDPTAKNWFLNH